MTKSLGQQLIEAVEDSTVSGSKGIVVRPKINVCGIRKNLGLTQSAFAKSYHIQLNTLRQWEQGDKVARLHSYCIFKMH